MKTKSELISIMRSGAILRVLHGSFKIANDRVYYRHGRYLEWILMYPGFIPDPYTIQTIDWSDVFNASIQDALDD